MPGKTASKSKRANTRKSRERRPREPAELVARRERLQLYASAVLASLTGWVVAAMFASVAYYWTRYLVLGLAITLRDITLREVGVLRASPRAVRGAEAA